MIWLFWCENRSILVNKAMFFYSLFSLSPKSSEDAIVRSFVRVCLLQDVAGIRTFVARVAGEGDTKSLEKG